MSPAVVQRYAGQLSLLITLGIVEEYGMKRVVEALEKLTAAAIGVDDEEANITVDAVITELMW